MWKLYEQHAHPLTKIVQGVPVSWDPAVATLQCSQNVSHAAWSPCSRFIAISFYYDARIQILDAVTLKKLKFFTSPHSYTRLLNFSPNGLLFTWISSTSEIIISWDLQTGLMVSSIPITEEGPVLKARSITYSGCGTMIGVLFKKHNVSVIRTYNVLIGTPIYSHPVEKLVSDIIWTHGEGIQFTAVGSGSITIWEVGFTSKHPPTEVKSLPTPNNFDPSKKFHFLPTCSQLAFVLEDAAIVWDAQHSKPLLNFVDAKMTGNMTFSLEGNLFACETYSQEIYLWKKYPTGYTLYQKIVSARRSPTLHLSPNGQLIVGYNGSFGSTIQLWRTMDSTTSPSSIPIQIPEDVRHFVAEFSPDESLAATARLDDNMAMVLDLKSGIPQLIIDAGTSIYGLRVAENTIIIVGDKKIITWNLPVGVSTLGHRMNINDSIHTILFDCSASPMFRRIFSASISPDFKQIAVIGQNAMGSYVQLILYDTSTGEILASIVSHLSRWGIPWFTPDGSEVWYHDLRERDGWDYSQGQTSHFGFREANGWVIQKGGDSNTTQLERIHHPSGLPPWESVCGYQVTVDGWILNSSKKRLLLLPNHWQSSEGIRRVWGKQFLALLHRGLSEVVLLEPLEG